jgi:hypothetical protein
MAALFLWMAAGVVRFQAIPYASVDSDALGQYLAAWALGAGVLAQPPNPEGGYALIWWVWPVVEMAGSLEGLYRLRFAQGALMAPLTMLAARWLLGGTNRGWAAAVAAGAVVALDPGLVDTLVSSFRGYGAPELGAVATLGLAGSLRGRWWGPTAMGLAIAAAVGQHPMAAGLVVGAIAVGPMVVERVGGRAVLAGVLATMVSLLPRWVLLVQQASCGDGWSACLGRVALGSSEPALGRAGLLMRALQERVTGDFGLIAGALLFAAVVSALWRLPGRPQTRDDLAAHALARWGLGSVVGIILVGLAVESLRPYHLRIAAAPLALLVGVGLTRNWLLSAGLVATLGALWTGATPTSEVKGAVERADHLAQRIESVSAPLRVDRVWYDGPAYAEPAGVVLAAVLQGQDPARFTTRGGARRVLLVAGGPASTAAAGRGFNALDGVGAYQGGFLAAGNGWLALEFADPGASAAWAAQYVRAPYQAGGAWDWEVALHPEDADIARSAWDLTP